MSDQVEVVVITPPVAESKIDQDLVNLTQYIWRKHHAGEPYGYGLGGEFGYGVEFDNQVFSMFPFYWGDCTCGFDGIEEYDPPHDDGCYQVELKAREIEAGVHYSQDSRLPYDELRALRDTIYDALTEKYGLSRFGCAVHCTCTRKRRWQEWFDANKLGPDGHASDCLLVVPNFLHKPSGLRIDWYKWIGRDTKTSRPVSPAEWRAIFDECVASV
jgi:hypothetical protein